MRAAASARKRLQKRYILDTNLLISAALNPKSVSYQVFQRAIEHGQMLQSFETFNELREVIFRPKFDRYLSDDKRKRFLERVQQTSKIVIVRTEVNVCRDSKDDKFLALALDGRATAILTGDQDLLVLHPFRDIPILSLARFLEENP